MPVNNAEMERMNSLVLGILLRATFMSMDVHSAGDGDTAQCNEDGHVSLHVSPPLLFLLIFLKTYKDDRPRLSKRLDSIRERAECALQAVISSYSSGLELAGNESKCMARRTDLTARARGASNPRARPASAPPTLSRIGEESCASEV